MSVLSTQDYPRGSVIFREGDKPAIPCMYDIISGRVDIYLNYEKPNQMLLTTVDPDKDAYFFGEMSLIDPSYARSATAVASEDCTLRMVTEDSLQEYFHERPMFVLQIMQQMSERLRGLTKQYVDNCHVIAEQETSKNPHSEMVEKYAGMTDEDLQKTVLSVLANSSGRKSAAEVATDSVDSAVKELPAKTVVFSKGDRSTCMYELLEGSIGIYADYGLSTQKKLVTLSAEQNRFFGEMGLLDAMPRSATAVTEADCKLRMLDTANLKVWLADDPAMLLAIMRQMSSRTRDLTHDYRETIKTIAESRHYADGKSKPEWLVSNMKKFAGIWHTVSRAFGAQA